MSFFHKLIHLRWPVIGLAFIVIGATVIGLPKLTKDTTADAFIDPDSPALVYKAKVEEAFGITDPIVIALINRDANGVFDPISLKIIRKLTDEVGALPYIDPDRVVSLATENNIVGTNDGLIVEGFLEANTLGFRSPVGTLARGEEIRNAIADFPLYSGSLVAKNGSASLIIAEILDEDRAQETYDAVIALVEATTLPNGVELHVAGEGAVAGYLSTYIDADASRLNPLAAIIITLILILAFRSMRAAIVPNLIVLATVLGSFGLMGLSGTSFFVITNGLLVNLIGIAVADSIHVLSAFYAVRRTTPYMSQHDAVAEAMRRMWRPITLTSVTTIAGFLALSVSSVMPPVSAFGLFGAIGVFLAWIYSMTLLPALLSVWPSQRVPAIFRSSRKADTFERIMQGVGRRILSAPRAVVGTTLFVFVVSLLGASQLVVDEDRINNFQQSEPVYVADKAINAEMDGIYALDVLVEGAEAEALYQPDLLRRIEALQSYMETLPGVNGTSSVVDYVKQLHRAVNEGDPAFYTIPDDPDLVAQLFFLYGASADPTDFEEEVDYDYQRALVRASVDNGRHTNNKVIVPALEDYLQDKFDSDAAYGTATGRVSVNYYWIDGIERSNFVSVLLSLAAVTLAAMLIFRSAVIGSLAALPVLFAVLLVYAIMGFMGIPLGVGTSMFAAIAIGLSVDFAVHTMDRLREIGRASGLTADTLQAFYPETGRALFFNFIAVAGGFGVLATSSVPPLVKFGSLVAVAVTVAFLISITLLPTLAVWLKPRALQARPITETSYATDPHSA